MDIFEREMAGEIISVDDPEYGNIFALITDAQKLIAEINAGYRTPQEIRDLFSLLTGVAVDPDVLDAAAFLHRLWQEHSSRKRRFYQSLLRIHGQGRHHPRGQCSDRPEGQPNHHQSPSHPGQRRSTFCAPILINRNAWIGVGASVMPGITIGENAIVAAKPLSPMMCPPTRSLEAYLRK